VSVEIIFDQSIDRSPPIRVGPVAAVMLEHRAIRAGSSRFLRHVDGGWHVEGASYLRARIVPVGRGDEVRLTFEGPWHRASPSERGGGLVLYGDRALLEPTGSWVATDDRDGRCWVAERTGLANHSVSIAAA
jgi:hypothetical protein